MRIRVTATPKDPLDLDSLVKALVELARERRQNLKTKAIEKIAEEAKPISGDAS